MPVDASRQEVRILVVDCDPAVQTQLGSMLQSAGFPFVAYVETEVEAMAAVSAISPAVAIFGEQFADGDILQRVRTLDPALKVLLVTGAGASRPRSSQGVPVDGCITVPFSKEQFISTLELALHHREPPQSTGTEQAENSSSVLIAEADPAVRRLLCAILEAEGYNATEAADEDEARRLVLTMRFDVVIVDRLSTSPGRPPLAAQLLSIVPAMCVVFLSPTATNPVEPQGTLGNIAFLPKPFAISSLLETIDSLVRKKRPS